jgi:ABC-type transporter Mla subunit MlaD
LPTFALPGDEPCVSVLRFAAVRVIDRAFGLTLGAVEAGVGAARGLASLPQLVATLEELNQRAAVLDRIADGIDAVERLADGIDPVARLARGTGAVTRIADALPLLERLIADVSKSQDLKALPEALASLGQLTRTMQPLSEAVSELNRVVASLNNSIAPLQGTAERVGRLVDRLPASRRRSAAAVESPFIISGETES